MRRTACFALAAAALTAAVFACTSSSNSSTTLADAGSDSSTTPADAGSDGGCTGEAAQCTAGGSATCVDGQWACPLDGPDCSCAADAGSIPAFSCGPGFCGINDYCLLYSLPDGGGPPPSLFSPCHPIPNADSGTTSCESILGGAAFGGDAGACTCSEGIGFTVTCPVFPCGQSVCEPNEYCEFDFLPDGGPSSGPQCDPLPSCDGGAPTCACLLASRSDDGGTCTCTIDGYGRPTLDCPAP
jgi:hypothetical protein